MLYTFIRDERGSTSVEFMLALPIFLTFAFGSITLGYGYWVRNSLQYGVNDAGRYLSLNSAATQAELRTRVLAKMTAIPNADVPSTRVLLGNVFTVQGINYRTINASFTRKVIKTFTVRASATVPVP